MAQLTLLLLLSVGTAVSADDSCKQSDRPTLAGRTLEVASAKLVEKQRPSLSCGFRYLPRRSFYADLIFIASKGKPEPEDDVESERVTVRRVLKRPGDVALYPHDTLNLPRKYVPKN